MNSFNGAISTTVSPTPEYEYEYEYYYDDDDEYYEDEDYLLPPPPPPSSEVMLVKSPEKTSPTKNTSPIMSSFKPDDPQTQPQSG